MGLSAVARPERRAATAKLNAKGVFAATDGHELRAQ